VSRTAAPADPDKVPHVSWLRWVTPHSWWECFTGQR